MTNAEVVVRFSDVSKEYKLYTQTKNQILSLLLGVKRYTIKTANSHIDFEINRGESVAIFGQNGAGKSTLLKMITGVVYPTSGSVEVNGRVSAMLELTAGFDDQFTGRENIYIKGMLLGLSREETAKIEQDIVDFADLGEYIDQPVRTYSSGMKSRLGFAVNSHIEPDILVIDEALSVGDAKFKKKCKAKIDAIRHLEHVTVILVTHAAESALEFCERGLVLVSGELVFDGPIAEAAEFYNDSMNT